MLVYRVCHWFAVSYKYM